MTYATPCPLKTIVPPKRYFFNMNPSPSPVSESPILESSTLNTQPPNTQASEVMADAIATPLSEPEDPTKDPAKDPTKDPTYVKLAMRNMVRQGGKSIFHFALTTMGLLGLLVGLAFITR